MLDARRMRIVKVMIGLYGFLGLALAYYFFYTPGIAMDYYEEARKAYLVVKNDSSHTIEDLTIYAEKTGTKTQIAFIQRLEPKQAHSIAIQPEYGHEEKYQFIAEAPYHESKKKTIAFNSIEGSSPAPIQLKLQLSNQIALGKAFDFNAQLCNPTLELILAEFTQNHAPEFFQENPFTTTLALNAQECTIQNIHLTPLRPGTTQILFNLKVNDTTSAYQQEIVIEP
ncbi:MAG: hypothetical protein HY393_03900 [Candidatus Diapherotrites archaeon]|nr:hypothetical protein [Candidatus Diapherotrites archaeon]